MLIFVLIYIAKLLLCLSPMHIYMLNSTSWIPLCKLDLIHGACQPALNGGLVGLFNPTTVGFLTNAPISPDAPRFVLLCFVKKQYQTRGIGFKKPTPRKGAGRSAFLGKTRDFESSVEALIEVGSVFKMGHL